MTLPIAALAIQAGGSILSGIGQAEGASYQASVARNNAIVEQQNAAHAASAGAAQVENAGLKAREQFSDVRASEAAMNVGVNAGSAANVQQSARVIGGENTATVANNTALEVYGYQSQAVNDRAQAGLYQSEVPYDVIGGFTQAGGDIAGHASLFGGPSQVGQDASVPAPYQWMSDSGNYLSPGTEPEYP